MFKKATILEDAYGSDLILFKSDMELACYPFEGSQDFQVKAAKGYGKEWVEKNFPEIEIEIITL